MEQFAFEFQLWFYQVILNAIMSSHLLLNLDRDIVGDSLVSLLSLLSLLS